MKRSRRLHSGSSTTASQQLISVQSTGLDSNPPGILSPALSSPRWWTSGAYLLTPGLLLVVLHYLLIDTGRGKGLFHATVHPGTRFPE